MRENVSLLSNQLIRYHNECLRLTRRDQSFNKFQQQKDITWTFSCLIFYKKHLWIWKCIKLKLKIKSNKAERNGETADISQVDFWCNKSLLWDSSWSGERFYENSIERGIKKTFNIEVFDSIIAESKENIQFKEKKSKNFRAKQKETKLLVEVKEFPWRTL